MKKKAVKEFLFKYAAITLGCVVYSLGVALFLDAKEVAAGGVTGIAIVVSYLFDMINFPVNTGIIIFVINIPLLILGFIFFGKNFTLSTLYSTFLSSLFIFLLEEVIKVPAVTDNIAIAAVVGGALFGGGLGLIFRMGSSTGGTDVIVKILRKKIRHVKTGVISMGVDITIVCISAIVYRDFDLMFYTILSIALFTLFFDWVLYGGNSAKLVHIITTDENAKAMCESILKELDVGATYVDGEGAYTGESKRIIMCAVKSFLYPRLRDIVKKVDPKAFMIVSSAKEIYGEGYKPHDGDDL